MYWLYSLSIVDQDCKRVAVQLSLDRLDGQGSPVVARRSEDVDAFARWFEGTGTRVVCDRS